MTADMSERKGRKDGNVRKDIGYRGERLSCRQCNKRPSGGMLSGEGNSPAVSFEKHKIFLYKEDFEKFLCGLQEAIKFIDDNNQQNNNILPENNEENNSTDFKIDIDF